MCRVVTPGASRFRFVPLRGDLAADFVPVAAFERGPHGDGRVANALEAVEDVAVAIDVALGDLPVVRPGVARCAGVGEDDAACELAGIDVELDPTDAVDAQLDRRDAAVERRAVILNAGRNANGLALDVHRHLEQMVGVGGTLSPPGQRAAGCDGQRGRSGDAGTGRRLAARVSVAFSS